MHVVYARALATHSVSLVGPPHMPIRLHHLSVSSILGAHHAHITIQILRTSSDLDYCGVGGFPDLNVIIADRQEPVSHNMLRCDQRVFYNRCTCLIPILTRYRRYGYLRVEEYPHWLCAVQPTLPYPHKRISLRPFRDGN